MTLVNLTATYAAKRSMVEGAKNELTKAFDNQRALHGENVDADAIIRCAEILKITQSFTVKDVLRALEARSTLASGEARDSAMARQGNAKSDANAAAAAHAMYMEVKTELESAEIALF